MYYEVQQAQFVTQLHIYFTMSLLPIDFTTFPIKLIYVSNFIY